MMLCVNQFHDVEMLRLGRLERIHPDLHHISEELLVRDVSSVYELDKFYASKVHHSFILGHVSILSVRVGWQIASL